LVKAFYETFKNKKNKPALILKSSTGVAGYMSRDEILNRIKQIRKSIDSKILPNIYVLNGEFTDSEMNELYNNPKVKAMISLTKGEGFGRPLLEFTTTGKPVIASGWSGHTDFLHKNHSILIPGNLEPVHPSASNNWLIKESRWFQPDTRFVGQVFRDTFEKPKESQSNAKRQKYYTQQNFSWEKMKDLIDITFTDNIPEFAQKIELNLPKLNLPKL
jgi:glycosyltransferase involved in cell wall biosynthesis